jgi:hypothetical protein
MFSEPVDPLVLSEAAALLDRPDVPLPEPVWAPLAERDPIVEEADPVEVAEPAVPPRLPERCPPSEHPTAATGRVARMACLKRLRMDFTPFPPSTGSPPVTEDYRKVGATPLLGNR